MTKKTKLRVIENGNIFIIVLFSAPISLLIFTNSFEPELNGYLIWLALVHLSLFTFLLYTFLAQPLTKNSLEFWLRKKWRTERSLNNLESVRMFWMIFHAIYRLSQAYLNIALKSKKTYGEKPIRALMASFFYSVILNIPLTLIWGYLKYA